MSDDAVSRRFIITISVLPRVVTRATKFALNIGFETVLYSHVLCNSYGLINSSMSRAIAPETFGLSLLGLYLRLLPPNYETIYSARYEQSSRAHEHFCSTGYTKLSRKTLSRARDLVKGSITQRGTLDSWRTRISKASVSSRGSIGRNNLWYS